ncbi:hypothetical protein JCM17845_24970 [Iodidimonas gelatinilytica]|uniref:Uncharacterized protein n=1 Tax=Iodidimonas gelatinilytica TaxID=1236966 RepID=A0A5A7N2E8_9PROT|nr:hypothetical protein [Iodidimonas gelatinilytica]GER01874.1 hypothetical protein JCM17845_24970 [Iodidimonas gelatinilytica]
MFLTKIDTLGNVVFSRLLGSATNAEAFSLAVDSQDNVIIAGSTTDNLGDNTRISGTDSFVTKFSARGDRIFTYQLDTVAQDKPAAIAIDADDNIILTGFSDGAINAATPSNGGRDVMLLKIDGDSGQRIDEALIGSATTERGEAVAIAEDGNILLASIDNGRAVLRKVDVNDFSNILFEQDLGQINNSGAISGLRVSGSNIFLAGSTSNSGFTGTAASIAKDFAGDTDGFVLKLTDNGSSADADFVSFVGTEAFDKINDIAVGASSVFVVGSTRGALEAGGREGPTDAFITRIDMATGAIEQVQQFGLLLTNNEATGIAFTNTGPSVLDALGLPAGTVDRIETRSVDSQTTAKAGDYFDISIDGGRKRRITLNEGDTFSDIARRINRLSFRGDVSADGSNGKLVIRANGSASVDLIAGEGSSDLLGKLGLKSQRLLGTDALFNLNDDDDQNSSSTESDLGGVFAFKLDGPLGLQDRQTAAFTLTQIQEAINTSQRAFRSLSPSILDTLGDQLGGSASGVVPTRLQSQLANYSAALSRLQSGSGGGGFFI